MKLARFSFLIAFLIFSCAPQKPFYNTEVSDWEQSKAPSQQAMHSLFLIGDAGKSTASSPVFETLQNQLNQAGDKGTLVFLGDNIYPKGLPSSNEQSYEQAAGYLTSQLELAKKFAGKSFFIPGNHDWDKMGEDGWEKVQRQEAFVEEYLAQGNTFLPDGGCPGPVEVAIAPNTTLLIIDTQWWLHDWEKPRAEEGCEIDTDWDFLIEVAAALERNKGKRIIVAAHHPLFSNGLHGGHVKPSTHLFPLAELKKNLYLPLPGLGSIYAFYRTVIGNKQDIPNPRFKQLKKALLNLFADYPNLTYVSGHEHNLQYFKKGQQHYVVSGAGCKETYTTHRKKAMFAYGKQGFSRIDFYENGQAWLSFYALDTSTGQEPTTTVCVFRQPIGLVETPKVIANPKEAVNYEGQVKQIQASKSLEAQGIKQKMLGENYRKEWAQLIDSVPVLDIGTMHGGLKIIKKGGGMQTKSLRLEAPDGKQYALRTIEKFPESAVPDALRGTIGEEVVKDQISSSHPYGAFAVPPLAEAAGIYHTNPKLVYLPDDPRLGEYRLGFGNRLYLFEERPDDEHWKEASFFGNPRDITSTPKLIKKLQKDNDNYVDQAFVVRSRLFDFWIGDWDRHEDQWRWAEFKDEDGNKYYRPIPRDRDQAFFFSDGIVMAVGTRKWGIRKFQGFHGDIRDIAGLGFNARYFDRSFMTEPSLEVWRKNATELQAKLTDEVIAQGIAQLPNGAREFHGDEIIQKLKERRKNLVKYAEQYYLFLAKKVSVLGSDKHELFKVTHLADGNLQVEVFKRKKDGETKQKLYSRTFKPNETQEVRLYGLGGEDIFEIAGSAKSKIRIRIIGGEDEDQINKTSKGSNIYVYDQPETTIEGNGIHDRRSSLPTINEYDRRDFQYETTKPILNFSFNPDDGIFIGGGVSITKQGFRKAPYASKHTVKANYAPRTNSYNFTYKGEWRHAIGKWDAVFDGELHVPSFTNFFYGLGNDTKKLPDTEQGFYRVRFSQIAVDPQIRRQSTDGTHTFTLGSHFQFMEFEDANPDDRYIAINPTTAVLLEQNLWFVGFSGGYIADTRNNKAIPTSGVLFRSEVRHVEGDNPSTISQENDISFTRFKGDFAAYLPLGRTKQTVLAIRAGGATNVGRFGFFQANTLGGLSNLRGHSRMRFAGRSSVYQNTELRFRLFDFYTPLFPGGFGITAINDVGRVWADGENSDTWHHGYGGGIWLTPFESLSLSIDHTISADDKRTFIRFGFMF